MKTAATGRTAAVTSLAFSLTVALAACASNTDGNETAGRSTRTIQIALTDAGCDPAKLDLPAGPVTFRVHNDGTGKVSEFEVTDGERILGEVENVTAGLERTFSLELQPGSYGMECPGGSSASEGTLTVTANRAAGATGAADDAELAAVAERYRGYLERQMGLLVSTTTTFANAVAAGDLAAARRAYAPARVPYERIEPVAESFRDLDSAIDARAGDVPAAEWGGFHKIEQALWVRGITKGMEPVARKLLADVTDLQRRVGTVRLHASQIANGANELLDEVSKSKIFGEEERYSHTDLVDFKANVDGSRAAFEAVRPALDKRDADLAALIERRFQAVDQSLARYRSGTGYVSYNRLTDADIRKLSQAIDALAEPLSEVSAKLVGS
jgi:iron uptake system component EfeO